MSGGRSCTGMNEQLQIGQLMGFTWSTQSTKITPFAIPSTSLKWSYITRLTEGGASVYSVH